MLRESSEYTGDEIELGALTAGAAAGGAGIPHDRDLIAFAEAVIGGNDAALVRARADLQAAVGDAALVDAAGIVGMFNGLDRVADATGAPLEDWKAADSEVMRGALGIGSFALSKAKLEVDNIS